MRHLGVALGQALFIQLNENKVLVLNPLNFRLHPRCSFMARFSMHGFDNLLLELFGNKPKSMMTLVGRRSQKVNSWLPK